MKQKVSVSNIELIELINNDKVTIIDVREKDEFDLGHILGAKNIPVYELAERCREFSENKIIVTYCGKGGGRSERAANILSDNNKSVFWLEGGYNDWASRASQLKIVKKSLIFHQNV